MADDNPPPNIGADFYEKENYEGKLTQYTIHDTKNFAPKKISDLYKSAKVGTGVKVLCSNEPDIDGSYHYVGYKQPDIEGLPFNYISVDPNDTHVFKYTFIDNTGGYPKQYSLTIQVHDLGKRIVYSNDGPTSKIAGIIEGSGVINTIAVSVRDEKTEQYILNGSIYYKWDDEQEAVIIEATDEWPPQLQHERDGPASFVVTLKSLP
ncbi:membrane binding-domain-containing protein [Xylaria telfairii]|nr:membrane binding-domain-containing protein [Xylaria telfairii]